MTIQLGMESLWKTAESHRAMIDRLIPIAQGLARVSTTGVIVADVRREAVRQGLLPANAKGRELSFLGAVMRAAQLVPTAEWRRSEIDASHGNLQRVWRAA